MLGALGLVSSWPLLVLCPGALALGCFLGGRPDRAFLIGIAATLALLGLFRYDDSLPALAPSGIAQLNEGGEVTLRGVVEEEPEQRERTQRVRLKAEAYRNGDWMETHGRVLLTVRPFPEFRYGDVLEVTGNLETPPQLEGFDYRDYLLRQGIGSVSLFPGVTRAGHRDGPILRQAAVDLRRSLADGLETSLPEPEAALAQGILLGHRAAIPADVTDDFNRSGIAHLIAISGYNVMLVAYLCVGLLWPLLGRRYALAASMLLVVAYAFLVGGSPSVLRATAMGLIVLGAELAGRPNRSLRFLIIAVALLLFDDPRLVDDVSFQLSVLATAGIVLAAPGLRDRIAAIAQRLAPAGLATFIAGQLSVTIAASLAVLPVMALVFGRVSLIAIVVNVAAAPAFPVVLGASLVSAVAGWLDTGLGRLAGEVTYLPLSYLVLVARIGASVPGGSVGLGGVAAMLTTATLLGGTYLLLRRRPLAVEAPLPLRVPLAIQASAVLGVLAFVLWAGRLTPADERLRVSVLDVGQGDAILIQTPSGHNVLVDGGPSGSRLLRELSDQLPSGERDIDLVVLTHPQDDHVGGLPSLLERYDVRQALSGPRSNSSGAYAAWREGLAERGVPLLLAGPGTSADLGDGVSLEVLAPPESGFPEGEDVLNENSVVLRLVYGEVSFLLTGDLGFAGERSLLRSGANVGATVLKVGHHGSDGSSSREFVEAVSPIIAVISVGAENTFGHPSPSTRIQLAGIPVLRTDVNGRVVFKTDGRGLWVSTGRGAPSIVPLAVQSN
jgi:competence protein ComEC